MCEFVKIPNTYVHLSITFSPIEFYTRIVHICTYVKKAKKKITSVRTSMYACIIKTSSTDVDTDIMSMTQIRVFIDLNLLLMIFFFLYSHNS